MSFTTPTVIVTSSNAGNGGTSSPSKDTATPAYDLIVVVSGTYSSAPASIADSAGNTWRAHPDNGLMSASQQGCYMWWKENPLLSPVHTWSVTGVGNYAGFSVIGVKGAYILGDPKDQTSSAKVDSGSAASVQASVTPTQDNELVISGLGAGTAQNADLSVSGATKLVVMNQISGASLTNAVGYLIQTTKGLSSPQWTSSVATSYGLSLLVASFKSTAPAAANSAMFYNRNVARL